MAKATIAVSTEKTDLTKLAEKIGLVICDQKIILKFARENVNDPSDALPLIKSADRFNDELFSLFEQFEAFTESNAAQ